MLFYWEAFDLQIVIISWVVANMCAQGYMPNQTKLSSNITWNKTNRFRLFDFWSKPANLNYFCNLNQRKNCTISICSFQLLIWCSYIYIFIYIYICCLRKVLELWFTIQFNALTSCRLPVCWQNIYGLHSFSHVTYCIIYHVLK